MNLVDLLTMGSAALTAEADRSKALADAKQAALDSARSTSLEAVREALGLSTEMFEKFKPEYRFGSWPNVILHYKDQAIGFTVEFKNSTDKVRFDKGATAIEYLAVRMAEIERDTDRAVRETLQVLYQPISAWWVNAYALRVQFIGWDLPEVRAARAAMLKRVFEAGVLDSRSLRATWLEKVKQLDDLPEVAERLMDWTDAIERANTREHLLNCIEKRIHPICGEQLGLDDVWDEDRGMYSDVVTREEVDVYRAAAVSEGLFDDAEVLAAIAKREQQMLDAELRADIEAQRVRLEATLFRPFTYYTVRYGIVATDDEDERMVSTDSFDALHDAPDELGYWTTVRGKRVKPTFVALVEAHEVVSVREMLSLSWRNRLQRETEFGTVYVPPQVAEVTR